LKAFIFLFTLIIALGAAVCISLRMSVSLRKQVLGVLIPFPNPENA
jgi:hypothetical protein